MSLKTIREAIVAALQIRFPTWKVYAHGGRFTQSEIPFLLGKLPVILVGCIGIESYVPAGKDSVEVEMRLGIYMLATDRRSLPRHDMLLDTVEEMLLFLSGATWGGLARNVPSLPLQAQNLYAVDVEKLRLAVWGIAVTQVFKLSINPT